MRSLRLKLTLAFLVVGLTGAVLVAIFVGQRTQTEFSRFVLDRSQSDLMEGLVEYYLENGSWEDLEAIAIRSPFRRYGREFYRAPVILAEPDGTVVLGAK